MKTSITKVKKEKPILFLGSGAKKFQQILAHPNASYINATGLMHAMSSLSLENFLQKSYTELIHSQPFYIKDFEILVSLGVFNGSLMNDAIYKFKRYEDSSLEYSGISKNQNEKIGLWDTSINKDDMKNL